MRGEISWQVELAVKPGELDNFRTAVRCRTACGELGAAPVTRGVKRGNDTSDH